MPLKLCKAQFSEFDSHSSSNCQLPLHRNKHLFKQVLKHVLHSLLNFSYKMGLTEMNE